MFGRRHIGENPMYLAEPPVSIEYDEEDFFEEDYTELYHMLFEDIVEANREFLDYEEHALNELRKYEME